MGACRGQHRAQQVSWKGVVGGIVDDMITSCNNVWIIDVKVSWFHVVEYIVGTRIGM